MFSEIPKSDKVKDEEPTIPLEFETLDKVSKTTSDLDKLDDAAKSASLLAPFLQIEKDKKRRDSPKEAEEAAIKTKSKSPLKNLLDKSDENKKLKAMKIKKCTECNGKGFLTYMDQNKFDS